MEEAIYRSMEVVQKREDEEESISYMKIKAKLVNH